jgi:HlyD family secretion protein
MKHLKSKWTVIIALLTAIVLFAAFSFGRGSAAQYVTAKVEQGDIRDVVQATGTINAVTTVQVGSQVSGTISKLFADFNSPVKKNQVIVEIDPSLFQGAVLQAKADLENARANVAAAQANLGKAKATVGQTKSDYARTVELTREGVMSQQQLDVSQANNDSAVAGVNAAQATLEQAKAQVAQKAAALQVAQINLSNTIIRSPIDGVVTNRTVDVGQTVAASLQAPNLFNIAQDLSKMQVGVSTDESDVGQIKVGQSVTFKVDAFPNDTFRGKVEQIRMNPTTVQNVVTYDTVVAFDNPGNKLFPGMTAYVSIPVAEASNIVKVPNAALRFSPSTSQDQKALTHKSGVSPNSGLKSDMAVLWKLGAVNRLEPVQVKTGITDHTYTEIAQVLSGTLNPGDQLITGALNSAPKSASGSAPGMNAGRMGAGRIGH